MSERFLTLALVAMSTMPVFSANENSLFAENITATAGQKEILLTVCMNNVAEISDLQFDLTLPAGFSISVDDDGFERIDVNPLRTTTKKHSVDSQEQADGSIRVVCASSKGYIFSGSEGGVIDIHLDMADNVASGSYTVNMKNIVLSNADDTFYGDPCNSTITISEGEPTPPVNIGNYTLAAEDITAVIGQKGTLFSVCMQNEKENFISDLQFDLYLPQGVAVSADEDDILRIEINPSRTSSNKHSVSYNKREDNSIRVVCYSSKGYTFSGTEGAVVDIYLDVADDMAAADYQIELKNAVMSNSDTICYSKDTTATITIAATYHLKFVAEGTVVSDTLLMAGETIAYPQAPEKEGYTGSWDTTLTEMPSNDVTIKAVYTINQYTVTFKVDGEVYKTLTQDYGTAIAIPEAPTKEGYTFSGWQEVAGTVPAQDLTYDAIFTVNQYTLKFVADGQVVSEKSVDYGSTITAPQAPAKTGYTFVSWGDIATTMPARDVTYTAEYSINQYTITFKVDGEVYKTLTQDYGTAITAPESPTKEGYTFSGWKNVVSTVPAQNVTYEANFTINQYTLKFVADGQVVSEESVDYGSAITAPNAPAKTGYTFVSWGDVAATMPAKDVTYTAQYKVNQYKLTYLIDGNVYKTYTLDYDSVITPEGDPEDDDYFYAWEDIPERMPDHDVQVNAYITGIAAGGHGWGNAAGIDESELANAKIFTVDGKRIHALQKGVNIIRYTNGTTKKIVVK